MSIEQLIDKHEDATDAEIVSLYERQSYRPLRPSTVAAWMALEGRSRSLKAFAEGVDADEPAAVTKLRGSVGTLLLSLTIPGATIDLSPGQPADEDQRGLVEAVSRVGLPGVGPDDVAALITKARTRPEITEADVAAERQRIQRTAVADAWEARLFTVWSAAKAKHIADGTELPNTIEVPE